MDILKKHNTKTRTKQGKGVYQKLIVRFNNRL